METAIQREKAIKNWKRAWKMKMLEEMNPGWRDLYPDLLWRDVSYCLKPPAQHLDSGIRRNDGTDALINYFIVIPAHAGIQSLP